MLPIATPAETAQAAQVSSMRLCIHFDWQELASQCAFCAVERRWCRPSLGQQRTQSCRWFFWSSVLLLFQIFSKLLCFVQVVRQVVVFTGLQAAVGCNEARHQWDSTHRIVGTFRPRRTQRECKILKRFFNPKNSELGARLHDEQKRISCGVKGCGVSMEFGVFVAQLTNVPTTTLERVVFNIYISYSSIRTVGDPERIGSNYLLTIFERPWVLCSIYKKWVVQQMFQVVQNSSWCAR